MSQTVELKPVQTLHCSVSTVTTDEKKRVKLTVPNVASFSNVVKPDSVTRGMLDKDKYRYLFQYLIEVGITDIPETLFMFEYEFTKDTLVFTAFSETVARVAFAELFYKANPDQKLKMVKTIKFNAYETPKEEEVTVDGLGDAMNMFFTDDMGDY